MRVASTSPELIILECGSTVRTEARAVGAWLRKRRDLDAYQKVNFYYELQPSLEAEFGFSHFRTVIPGELEDSFLEEAYRILPRLGNAPLARTLPYFPELLAGEIHFWARDFVQQLALLHLIEGCAKGRRRLLVVMPHPALDLRLESPAWLARELARPVTEVETRGTHFLASSGLLPERKRGTILMLVEDSGSKVNLTSALAILERLRAAGRRTVVVTRTPTVVSAMQEAGAENLRPSVPRQLPELPKIETELGQSTALPSRPGYPARIYALLRFPVVLTYQHVRLRLHRLVLGVASWLGRRLVASPEEYGIAAALAGHEGLEKGIQRLALRLPYRIQASARNCRVHLFCIDGMVEELEIRSCLAIGEANMAAALLHLAGKGLKTCGVLPVLISKQPGIESCWPAQRHLVYGEQARDVLEGAGIPSASIEVVGTEHFDRHVRRSAEQRQADIQRFCTRFPAAAQKKVVVLATECLPRLREDMLTIFRWLTEIPGVFVLLKVHPDDDLATYERLVQPGEDVGAAVVKDYAVAEILSCADLLVASHSNLIPEAAAAGVPSLAIQFLGRTSPLDFEEEGLCFGGQSAEDLQEKAKKILFDEEMCAAASAKLQNITRFNGPNDGRSSERIVDACLSMSRGAEQ